MPLSRVTVGPVRVGGWRSSGPSTLCSSRVGNCVGMGDLRTLIACRTTTVVHRSPIEMHLFVLRVHKRWNFGGWNWRRRPDLNRGWRFCRQGRDVYLVDSSCFLVGPTPPFSLVLGSYCSQVVPRFIFRMRDRAPSRRACHAIAYKLYFVRAPLHGAHVSDAGRERSGGRVYGGARRDALRRRQRRS